MEADSLTFVAWQVILTDRFSLNSGASSVPVDNPVSAHARCHLPL